MVKTTLTIDLARCPEQLSPGLYQEQFRDVNWLNVHNVTACVPTRPDRQQAGRTGRSRRHTSEDQDAMLDALDTIHSEALEAVLPDFSLGPPSKEEMMADFKV